MSDIPRQDLALVREAMQTRRFMRMIDGAVDQYCIENGKKGSDKVYVRGLVGLFRNRDIQRMCAEGVILDRYGNPIVFTTYDEGPRLSKETCARFAPGVSADFWGPYATK